MDGLWEIFGGLGGVFGAQMAPRTSLERILGVQSGTGGAPGAPKRDKMVKQSILRVFGPRFLALSFWLAKEVLSRRAFGLFLDLADPREPGFGLGKT